ncbi:ras family small GTPase [Naegleria gruberi]|uniref:Ras family small GTPase n=1 Tax=Naegleria gruberi TaxID=5762 RepID=D2W3E6_NAEGR|nr:ras family small GTPase [Naegleria gruberi]EFC36405.1 ras family small GTPase [Naegleria gruberi]|eukprot:XP_002669149.1 ras family small GTPase [Naegleria gruberi strain NEG-M]
MPEMERYFDRFWWKVWEIWFGINPSLEKEFSLLKEEMILKRELKRKVLMAAFIKFHIWGTPKKLDGIEKTKVVMIGKGGVGKSAMTVKYIQDFFIEQYDPTIEDVYRKQLLVDGFPTLFEVLDSAEHEYSSARDHFMRYGECFVLVCDLVDSNSVEEAEPLVEQLVRVKDFEENSFPVVFALNKVDLLNETDRPITIEKFTNQIATIIKQSQLTNTFIIETSAKTGENIIRVYEECVRLKRYGSGDNLKLLKEVIQHDSAFIETCKKQRKLMKQSKKCSVM